MTYRIRFEPRAVAEIIAARQWWLANRPVAPEAFDEEFDRARDFIRSMPHAGQPVRSSRLPELRRVLLGRIRYHLYYEVSEGSSTSRHYGMHHEVAGRACEACTRSTGAERLRGRSVSHGPIAEDVPAA